MWCYASRVENGETMCPTSMVPTLDMSSGNLVCCPSHVADKYTIQLLNSLEDELDDVEEEEVGRGLVRYAAYLHGQYGHYFSILKFFITYKLIYSHCIKVNYSCTLPKNVGCLEICDEYMLAILAFQLLPNYIGLKVFP
eukprot:UN22040